MIARSANPERRCLAPGALHRPAPAGSGGRARRGRFPVQRGPHRGGQLGHREGLVDEQHAGLHQAAAVHLVPGIARHEDHFRVGALLREERIGRVRAALDTLSERDREALLLSAEGLGYDEIAQTLGMAHGSIGTTLARARRRLVEAYRAKEDTRDAAS